LYVIYYYLFILLLFIIIIIATTTTDIYVVQIHDLAEKKHILMETEVSSKLLDNQRVLHCDV